jgi:biotin carboxylase
VIATWPPIVFVELNRTGTGRDALEKCKRFSVRPHVLTRAPWSYPSGYFGDAEVTVVDTSDPAAVLRACELIDPIAVTSPSELAIPVAAEVADRLGLIGPDPQTVELCRDKARQHRVMCATGVAVPPTVVAGDGRLDWRDAVETLSPPLVVKPARGTGSMRVRSFDDGESAVAYAEGLLRETEDRVLVQELVEGPEFSVEIVDGRAVAVMRKHLSRDGTFVETGHDCCGSAASCDQQDIVASAAAASYSLGLNSGPVHVEVRRGSRGPVLIEVNPRLAGGQIPAVVRHALGVDLVSETLRWLLGGKPRLHPIRETGAAIRFLLADRAGTLVGVGGIDSATSAPGIVETAFADPGSRVHLGDFRQRVAHLIAVAEDGAAAGRLADAGIALLNAEVEGLPAPIPSESLS